MSQRNAASLIETLVVIVIIGIMLAMLFPAVQSARTKALETQCKNNLHQINLAFADYEVANKRLPGPGTSGLVGGWTIALLPFLEQQNLQRGIANGTTIAGAPEIFLRRPHIFQCPVRRFRDGPAEDTMDFSHYVFIPDDRRKSYEV